MPHFATLRAEVDSAATARDTAGVDDFAGYDAALVEPSRCTASRLRPQVNPAPRVASSNAGFPISTVCQRSRNSPGLGVGVVRYVIPHPGACPTGGGVAAQVRLR